MVANFLAEAIIISTVATYFSTVAIGFSVMVTNIPAEAIIISTVATYYSAVAILFSAGVNSFSAVANYWIMSTNIFIIKKNKPATIGPTSLH